MSSEAVAPWDANPLQARAALSFYSIAASACLFMLRTFTIFEIPLRRQFRDKSATDTAVTIWVIADAFFGPFFGKVAGRYGVRRCLMVATAIMILNTLLFTRGVTMTTLYVGYFLGGVASAASVSPCTMAAVQLMPVAKQGSATAVLYFVVAAFAAVFLVPIKEVVREEGAHVGYVVQGLLQSICLGLCAIFLSPPNGQASEAVRKASEAVRKAPETSQISRQPFIFYLALYMIYLAGAGSFYFIEMQLCPILEETFPNDITITTTALPTIFIGEALARLVWGHAACKFPASLCYVAGMVILTASLNFWAVSSGVLSAELVAAALSYWSATSHWILMPVIVARTFSHEQAMVGLALLNTAGAMAGVIGGPVTALLCSSLGWPGTLHTISILPVIAAATLMMTVHEDKSRASSSVGNSSQRQSTEVQLSGVAFPA